MSERHLKEGTAKRVESWRNGIQAQPVPRFNRGKCFGYFFATEKVTSKSKVTLLYLATYRIKITRCVV